MSTNEKKSNVYSTSSIGNKISVCLLTYNHAEIIETTLRSIQHQTIDGYEIIISDDRSTDGTWEKILELAAKDARIRPFRTPRNLGMPGNANQAVAQSDRPYIALLHHDDIYRKDLLEKWATLIDTHRDVAFVFNPYGVFGSSYIYAEAIPSGRIDGRWLLERYLLPRWGCVVRGTAMVRRDAWENIGGMREQFGLLADIDLWMRLSMHWAAGYVPSPVIAVRQQRPSYYPAIYLDTDWSWKRRRYLYEIHAAIRRDYLDLKTLPGKLQWLIFRLRLNMETTKWLGYAVVRKKPGMIATSPDGATDYDLWPLRLCRSILQTIYR